MLNPHSPALSQSPSFQSFSWHKADVPPSRKKVLAEYAQDVGTGVATLLSLIEYSEIEAVDERPLLSEVDRGTLLRLAITASKMLARVAEEDIDVANTVKPQ